MHIDNSKEWHWLKGGILVSLLSVATYFIFAALAGRNYPFGITAGFGYIAAAFGGLFGGLNYCPGTMIARIGEGKKDAIFALFGTALGIFIYALMIKPLKGFMLTGEITGDMSVLIGVNHWFLIIPAAIVFSGTIYFVNKKFSDDTTIF